MFDLETATEDELLAEYHRKKERDGRYTTEDTRRVAVAYHEKSGQTRTKSASRLGVTTTALGSWIESVSGAPKSQGGTFAELRTETAERRVTVTIDGVTLCGPATAVARLIAGMGA